MCVLMVLFRGIGLIEHRLIFFNNLPWVCTLAPLALFPVMSYLWLTMGNGNANFVFFQGLVMWVFYLLRIIEFCWAAIDIYVVETTQFKISISALRHNFSEEIIKNYGSFTVFSWGIFEISSSPNTGNHYVITLKSNC